VKQEAARQEITGVFVIRNEAAEFQPVTTGITGATDIEITKGLEPGQEIMVGPYEVIRNIKPGAKVKVDNRSGVELNKDE
jgi:HlyD family secretion protein